MKPMKAVFVGGRLNGKTMSIVEVLHKHCNGKFTEDLSAIRAAGGFCHSPVLDNQPLVDGYLSPMLDGGMLRYETQEVYDFLSR